MESLTSQIASPARVGPLFPTARPRRLRRTGVLRSLVRETELSVSHFVYPIFVTHGEDVRREVPSMPGIYQWSLDRLGQEVEEVGSLGIPAVLLFGLPEAKDESGSEAYNDGGIVQRAIRRIKGLAPELLVVTDVCLCEYTSHGHCGVIRNGEVDNDSTLDLLARTAVSHAAAGADIVAPSDMMDGRVGAVRQALDERGYSQIPIMAYSAKYASSFYGPFREAAECAPQFGDRRGYQMDPPNRREAVREALLDVAEGADIVMVKPALPYLDIIRDLRENLSLPVAAYNVSGEYSMIKAAASNGWLDERLATLEALNAIRRAGADIIISYHAKEVARWLEEKASR